MNSLKNVHFFRKVPTDITEATAHGGFISIAGAVLMVVLFLTELSAYMTVEKSMQILMDTNTEEDLKITFNVTMAHIPCKFATVDIADNHGVIQYNVTSNMMKWHVDKDFVPIALASEAPKPKYEDREHPDGEQISTQLTTENYESVLKKRPVTIVNFYAPWCYWSQRLSPVWEHAAGGAEEEFPGEVTFGKVDCTHMDSYMLCRNNHIMAFPTVRLFKDANLVSHQEYDGDRTVEALVNYVKHQRWATDALFEEEKAKKAAELAKKLASTPPPPPGGKIQGCRIEGHVLVGRAPGNMHITIARPGFSFRNQMINVSHQVHHLSFGESIGEYDVNWLPDEIRQFVSPLTNRMYITHENVTQEHYLKVVHTRIERLSYRKPLSQTYQYTITNAQFHDEYELPSAKFTYDLSPMQVIIKETARSFGHFLTSVCAIIGGVFTVTGLVDSIVYHGSKAVTKKD